MRRCVACIRGAFGRRRVSSAGLHAPDELTTTTIVEAFVLRTAERLARHQDNTVRSPAVDSTAATVEVVRQALMSPTNGDDIGTALEGRPLKGAKLSALPKDISTSLKRCDLSRADFSGCSFVSGAAFDLALCRGANFCGAQFRNVSFTAADLRQCAFQQCTFKSCLFRRCDLRDADLRGATFAYCDFALCDLSGSTFTSQTTVLEPINWWQSRREGCDGKPHVMMSDSDGNAASYSKGPRDGERRGKAAQTGERRPAARR
jgi:uncharacterized protein YjbI with pentapeptide repeats